MSSTQPTVHLYIYLYKVYCISANLKNVVCVPVITYSKQKIRKLSVNNLKINGSTELGEKKFQISARV